jgi:UDP-GlcNAc:undecaprenyl-phosphate GlcNAc-1-phosphate transferase
MACLTAMVVSWLGTPIVLRLAERVGAIDRPNDRKVHIHPVPRLGGVAVFLAFLVGLTIQTFVQPELSASWMMQGGGITFCIALLLMFLLGMWDDLRTLKPLEKLLVQVLLSSLVYAAGFRVSTIPGTFVAELTGTGAIDFLITTLWIVGITNAINLIDGLDGLAAGVAIIASMTIFAISLINHDPATAVIALTLAGALVGFLRYNFYPAKIFLGDSGSLFVGFALAVLTLQTSRQEVSGRVLAIPVLVLGLPIVDTLLAMVRRFLRSFLPKQQEVSSWLVTLKSIFAPDRSHVHHRLIARGLSHMRAVLLLYLVSIILGVGAIAIRLSDGPGSSLILLVIGLGLVLGIAQLRYREMALLRNGILLQLYMRLYGGRLLKRTAFQLVVDLLFVASAYSVAFYFASSINGSGALPSEFWTPFAVTCAAQILLFWLSGLYKGTVLQIGVGDAVRATKSVAIAAVISGILVFMSSGFEAGFVRTLFVLDFYLLLTFVLGSRFSHDALRYLFEKDIPGGKRVLIYGADSTGVLMLQNILTFDSQNITPIGFLDDDPVLAGKYLNGYPVYGGHWQLHRLLERLSVHEIILAKNLEPETLKRLRVVARSQGVVIRRFQLRLEDTTREVARTQKDTGAVPASITL